MSIALLIISHDEVGEALLASATGILGFCPLCVKNLSVTPGDRLDDIRNRAIRLLGDLGQEDGILILTDLLGSTPSNVASLFQSPGEVHVVAGLNLPMLIKILSHPAQNLQRLTELAMEGGQQGIRPGVAQTVIPLSGN
ncbi:MAG: PTS fructose transporter subunit IIA [Gammaproteobacteria bacterium]|nr:PTS fructose transporter subunit IIA [Gammaproteobacteria bacterium]MBU1656147.1 PTS fructose transporter subunit IIA [Gammaproteobacteria bacterium]MBU1960791.1 PTS fructose transporter subunit IIA [Gammaproteobacteria bacterium]